MKTLLCPVSWKPTPFLTLLQLLLVLTFTCAAKKATAATILMNATDTLGQTSFNAGTNWVGGAAPIPGNDYKTAGFHLRTPDSGGPYTFVGASLTIDSGSTLTLKTSQTITINNLILNASSSISQAVNPNSTATVAGNISVTSGTAAINALEGSVSDLRTLIIDSAMSGAGSITITSTNTANGIVVYRTSAKNYTGNTTIGSTNSAILQTDTDNIMANGVGKGNVILTAGSKFDLNGTNQSINGLSGSGTVDGRAAGAAVTKTLTLGNGNATGFIYSGVITDTVGTLNLTKVGTGTQTLSGANSYSGATTINAGVLSVASLANGSSNSNIGASTIAAGNLVLGGGTLRYTGATVSTNRNFTLTNATTSSFEVTNAATNLTISGASANTTGSLIKAGGGTLTLSGTNAHTGNTTVSAGILNVTGSLATNGSTSVKIAVDADGDFSSLAPTLTRTVATLANYGGKGSQLAAGGSFGSGFLSSADIRLGENSLGSDNSVTMQWRQRFSGDETEGLYSDVLNLTGMVNSGAEHGQTDVFTLQMTYDDSIYTNSSMTETQIAANGWIQLGTLVNGEWVSAISENVGTNTTNPNYLNQQMSWNAFALANSITTANLADFLGSWGVDTATNAVWAVLNHNSQFAVVPEPSSLALLLFGMFGIWRVKRKRRA